MDTHPELSMLAVQIERAKDHADRKRRAGEEVTMIREIIQSLRLTYATLLSGLDPRSLGPGTFVLETLGRRDHVLRHDGRPVPVNGAYLSRLLADASLDPAPGQILLLDPRWVMELAEQALGQIAHEQAVIEKQKAQLEEILSSGSGHQTESVEAALGSTEQMAVRVRSRKVDLIATSLAASDLMEKTPPVASLASKEPPAQAA